MGGVLSAWERPERRGGAHGRSAHLEEGRHAAVPECDVPHAQAAFQRQAVDKEAQEPLHKHAARDVRAQVLQVAADIGQLAQQQGAKHELVHLQQQQERVAANQM